MLGIRVKDPTSSLMRLLLPIAAMVLLAASSSSSASPSAASVISIGDGDTLRVADGSRRITIRLACIDAPETAQAPYGMASREELQRLAPVGSGVTLRILDTDRYGRTVAEVIHGGVNVNLAMVRSGQAFAYRQYLSRCDQAAYLGAERQAEFARSGVWAVTGGITRPWDWRQSRRNPSRHSTSTPAGRESLTSSKGGVVRTGSRTTCKSIGSFGRAQELLRQGHTYLDRNGDGVACESLR